MVIVAILGRSGSGKSTLEQAFEKVGYNRIISYTTRKIRKGEENHREYHFITRKQFEKLFYAGIIIENAEYNGNLYGAPKPVGHERNVIVIESDGLEKFKELYGKQVFSVYVDVPTEEIEKRLDERNNTTDRESRKASDDKKFISIEDKVDMIVNGFNSPQTNVNNIIHEMIKRGIL